MEVTSPLFFHFGSPSACILSIPILFVQVDVYNYVCNILYEAIVVKGCVVMSDFLVKGNRLAQIHVALSQRGIPVSCNQCNQGPRLIYEGSSPTFLLDDERNPQSQNFPVIILLCPNCGAIAEHSSIILGL